MKILMISNTFPYPPTRGGTQVRTFNLLKYIAQHHSVTLLTQKNDEVTEAEINDLRNYVEELVIFPQETNTNNSLIAKVNRFSNFLIEGTPPSVNSGYSTKMQEWINSAVNQQKFQVITCEHSVNESYIKSEWKNNLKTVVNIHSSVYRTCQSQLETNTSENQFRDRLYLPLLKKYEKNYCRKFSQIAVTTPEDKITIQDISGKEEIGVIPNGVDLEIFPYRDYTIDEQILIIAGGMDYTVNIDAACFFSLEVFPLIQAKYPDVKLFIVGSKPAQVVQDLGNNPNIIVTGRVPSMAEYLHKASIAVIPMRSGFGIKNKTLEAMAAGIPVVASDRGLEGLTVDSPLCGFRANKITEYVDKISKLFDNSNLRLELAYNARKMIESNFTWQQAGKKYEQLLID